MPENHRLSFYETHFELSFHRNYKWKDRSKGTISIVDVMISKVLEKFRARRERNRASKRGVEAREIALKYNTRWTWDISNFVIKS